MYRIKFEKRFKKSLEKLRKNGLSEKQRDTLYSVIYTLAEGKSLGAEYRDHKLKGELKDYRECHIQGDLLLVYQIIKDELVLVLIDLGTHSDLF